jgi:hypothetical protein
LKRKPRETSTPSTPACLEPHLPQRAAVIGRNIVVNQDVIAQVVRLAQRFLALRPASAAHRRH